MNSRTDQELLGAYAELGDEGAFSEVVRRYVNLVYSVALRVVCNGHWAEDVSQRVFETLAQNAASLAGHAVLAGWLHRTTYHISANIVRAEVRRRAREQQAAAMHELLARSADMSWGRIAPEFDDVLCELNQPDRDALILRYFQGQSAREMAATLGVSSEAAQKRVNRALDRLREGLAKRGISVGTSALAGLLTAEVVQAAPSNLAAALSAAAIASGPFQTGIATTATKVLVMTTLQKVLVSSVILAAIGTAFYHVRRPARQGAVALAAEQPFPRRERNQPARPESPKASKQRARAASARRPVAPPSQVAKSSNTTAARPFPSTQLYQLLKTKVPVLRVAQIEPFLKFNERSAPALLAGFRTTSDGSLLAEAMQRYSNDPQVSFEAAIRNGLSAEEQRQWLSSFKQADSDNSLASYLSAAAFLKTGHPAEAIQDLTAAASLPQFRDYAEERVQDDEQAYLAAGYSAGEAKLLANNFVATPYLIPLRELGQDLVALAGAYQNSGDASSCASALESAIELGRRLSDPTGGERLNAQLIGINIERTALNAMAPSDSYLGGEQTVQQRLDQLTQQKEAIHVLTAQADPLWGTLSEQGWIDYHAQLAGSGEAKALQWLVSNQGHP